MHSVSRCFQFLALLLLPLLATAQDVAAPFVQAALPYTDSALEPYITARTLAFHYGKHHRAYVDKANALVAAGPLRDKSPLEILRTAAADPGQAALFNNAAQAWNHDFFWNSMRPGGGGEPTGALADLITQSFGSTDAFRKAFATAATGHFASGWVWLVLEQGKLKIETTSNAGTPVTRAGAIPLLVCDLWEHAYYLDFQNRRGDFIQAFLDHLANWDFAAQQLPR